MIIQSNNIQEINNLIKKAKKSNPGEQIIIRAGDEDFNRKILELKQINVLLAPEQNKEKDKLKQRASGLNEFLCKLASKNNIKIGIDIENLQSLPPRQKAKILARIIQNIQLCKRTKTKIILWPEKKYSKLETLSFLTTLKGSTNQSK